MPRLDDEDDQELPSSSRSGYFTRADKGRQELREQIKSNQPSKADRARLQRDVLRQQVGRLANDADTQKRNPNVTPSREQEIAEQVQKSDEKASSDQIIQRSKREEAAKKQSDVEFQQNMG